jgi:hypothetical protein
LGTRRAQDASELTLAETVANIIIAGKELHSILTANKMFLFPFPVILDVHKTRLESMLKLHVTLFMVSSIRKLL